MIWLTIALILAAAIDITENRRNRMQKRLIEALREGQKIDADAIKVREDRIRIQNNDNRLLINFIFLLIKQIEMRERGLKTYSANQLRHLVESAGLKEDKK